jgi:UDP-3-O-[3-hydroxymyristoyl] glucosamine N-acyltransferase
MTAEIHPSAIVYPGTVLGEGVKVLENAVVGKQPTLSPRSTAKREPLPPTVIGAGTIVSTGAIVFAGSSIGARVILGDQSCIRERVTIGDDVVVGRGSLVENDTTIGAMTKILDKLAGAKVNVVAVDAVTSGKGRFGAIFWVKATAVAKASKVLGAR